jgi:hypothetical protein
MVEQAQTKQFRTVSSAPAANDPTKKSSTPIIKDAPFNIQPISNREPWLKVLFYGLPGAGKTTLVNTAVDCEPMRDILFVDAESGSAAVKGNPRIKNADLISHIPVTSFQQAAYIHQFLTSHCRWRDIDTDEAHAKLCELESRVTGQAPNDITHPKRYRTVLLDSLTELNEYSMYKLKGLDQAKLLDDPNDLVKSGWDEYNKNLDMMKMLVRAYRDLPVHLLICCGLAYTQDEMKRFYYSPALTGQLSRQVQGMVDIVGYMVVANDTNEKGERDRRVMVQPGAISGARFNAKNRRAVFKEDYFENPTMNDIMSKTGMLK